MNPIRLIYFGWITWPLLGFVLSACGGSQASCADYRNCAAPSDGAPRLRDTSSSRGVSDAGVPFGHESQTQEDSMSTTALDAGSIDDGSATSTRSDGDSLLANGSACSRGAVCQSGHCSAEICCDTECNERFVSCNVAGSIGKCTPLTEVFVDPSTGDDAATGLADDPLKTLKAALSAAKSGWTVFLEPGTYDSSSGEDWKTQVPEAVTIQAVVEGNAVLVGSPSEEGLTFLGGGAVKEIGRAHV